MTGQQSPPPPPGGSDPERGKGFKARKREDHALLLIRELQASLGDPSRAKVLLRELGRYYDPVLGGAIVDVPHQREIVEALEAGRVEEAETLIRARYELYIKDRAHLGRGDEV
jgi:DNA-binding GntR family transcriptional regulator